MDDKTLMELLEEEYRKTLEEVDLAANMEQVKYATAKLAAIHKHLMEMQVMETNNQLKASELEFKKNSAETDKQIKEQELQLKQREFERSVWTADKEYEFKQKEQELRNEEVKGEKHNHVVTWCITGLTALTGLVSLGLTNKWLKQTMSFEETGTFTSRSGKFVSDIRRLFGKG